MNYYAVKDLKRTRELWKELDKEREIIITKNGKPSAIMISISPEILEESLKEIRKGLFSVAIKHARAKAIKQPLDTSKLEKVIAQSRKDRKLN